MKRFLKKRWHGIPVGIIAVLVLAGVVAGFGHTFFGFTAEIKVAEPLTIEYNLDGNYGGDDAWHLLGDEDSLTLGRSAGDDFDMQLRITNDADNPLTVTTVITGVGKGYFTFTGWPDGSACPNGTTIFGVTADVNGDAPVGVYTINFTFSRS